MTASDLEILQAELTATTDRHVALQATLATMRRGDPRRSEAVREWTKTQARIRDLKTRLWEAKKAKGQVEFDGEMTFERLLALPAEAADQWWGQFKAVYARRLNQAIFAAFRAEEDARASLLAEVWEVCARVEALGNAEVAVAQARERLRLEKSEARKGEPARAAVGEIDVWIREQATRQLRARNFVAVDTGNVMYRLRADRERKRQSELRRTYGQKEG